MRTFLFFCVALSGVLLSGQVSMAHPGHDHAPDLRVWKDTEGLFEIQASFSLLRDDKVQLCKADGSMVWIPLAKLSQADRAWVQNRVEAIKLLNGLDPESGSAPTAIWTDTQEGPSPIPAVLLLFGIVALAAIAKAMRRVAIAVPAGKIPSGAVRRVALPVAAATIGAGSICLIAASNETAAPPAIQKHFEPFAEKLKFRSDEDFLYVESNGMPDHPMMIGIRAWQQQVPLPQAYAGNNAWRIPLHPKMAANPVSAKTALFRGAIALAVNGIPIFNPIKNDGRTDTLIAGELDDFGGHCGRGDDYHYHIGPVHLEKIVGKGNPIGYALDGYPLYGYTDANGKEPRDLDKFNGRMENGQYRYYSTKKYPYINGGMRGEVTVKEDQVDPQPRANTVRPSLTPLVGARITGFKRDDEKKTVTVLYTRNGKTGSVTYTIREDGTYHFVFNDGNGNETSEDYRARNKGGEGKKGRQDNMKDGKGNKKGGEGKKDGQGKGKGNNDGKKDGDGPRLPWLAAHFEELDTNMDGFLTLDELKKEIEKTFSGYDQDKDGVLTTREYEGRSGVRSALAGFVKGHAKEFSDSEGKITRKALEDALINMYQRADRKNTGKLTKAELSQTGQRNNKKGN